MKTRKWIAVALSLFLFGLLLGFAAPAQAKLNVVTTLPSFADIAREVGGDDVSVTSLARGNQDPHFVDAKPDLILKLHRADLLIQAGLQLEGGWLPPLQSGARNGKIQNGSSGSLDVSALMKLREVPQGQVDRSQGDVHPGGNPHYMLDPRNGIVLARALAKKFGALDSEHSEAYTSRGEAYAGKLGAKIAEWEKKLKPVAEGKPVVPYHRSWIYFFAWSGMDEVERVEPKPGIPPSPEHVVKLIREMKSKGVKLMVMETFYPKGVAEDVAQKTSATLLVLPTEPSATPEAKTYIDVFEQIVAKLMPVLGSKK